MKPIRTLIQVAMPAVIWIASLAPAALAQTDTVSDLQQAIARNEELLHKAAAVVRESNSAKARASLEAAAKIHELSKNMLRSGERPMVVVRVVQRARQAILSAINIARRETRSEESALRAMERAAQRLHQARAALSEYGDRDDVPARRLTEEAQTQLQRARDNMQEHLFSVALQLARASFEMSSRAIQMLKRDSVRPDDVRRELDRTENVLSRIEDAAGDSHDTKLRDAIEQARALQRRAHDSARAGRSRIAIEQTRRARMIALRIGRRLGEDNPGDTDGRAGRALRVTAEMIDAAMDAARDRGDEQTLGKLEEARRLLDEALSRLESGDVRAAMRLNRRARDLARRALSEEKDLLTVDSVEQLLESTDQAIERAVSRIGEGSDAAAELIDRARRHQKAARAALEDGQLRRAVVETRLARTLARRAVREANGG